METNIEVEARLYDLVEQFEFESLSETDKAFVLNYLTEDEYRSMRNVSVNTNDYYSQTNEYIVTNAKDGSHSSFNVRKIASTPIPFYKVAIAASVMLFLFAYILTKKDGKMQVAQNNTNAVQTFDTIFSIIKDTIYIEKEKLVFITKYESPYAYSKPDTGTDNSISCNNVVCPTDYETISNSKKRNSIENDSVLREFVVSSF